MLPRNVEIPKEEFLNNYLDMDDVVDDDVISEAICDYLSDNYDFCVEGYGWEIKKDVISVYDIEWDDDYEDYLDELYDLDLDDTAFEYYASIITDMHYGDRISVKNGNSEYDCYEDVLDDARRTAGQNQFEDED